MWAWHPDAGVKFAGFSCKRRWQTSPVHRGEHEVSRKTIARGMPGCSGVTRGDYTRVLCFLSHARLRAHRAPGIPCALVSEGAGPKRKPRAKTCGEIAKLCPPSLRAQRKQSTFPLAAPWIASRSLSSGARSRDPLARNDVDREIRIRSPEGAKRNPGSVCGSFPDLASLQPGYDTHDETPASALLSRAGPVALGNSRPAVGVVVRAGMKNAAFTRESPGRQNSPRLCSSVRSMHLQLKPATNYRASDSAIAGAVDAGVIETSIPFRLDSSDMERLPYPCRSWRSGSPGFSTGWR